ncbi:MAG: hypothetical protein KC636_36080, partial [Myxococcales bacterium]|nr:hypothetical protein [Myxococcales bacterium]
ETTDTTTTEPSGPLRIVVLGSSTAAGKNLDVSMYGGDDVDGLNDRYSVLLESYLDASWPGSVVDNVAVAGDSTFEGLPTDSMTVVPMGLEGPDPTKNVSYAIAQGANAIIVNYPSPRVATPQWVANHREIVDAAEAAGVAAWVALPQPAYELADVAVALGNRDALLAEFGEGQTIDFFTPLLDGNGAMDPIYALTDTAHHPNAAANMLFFEAIVSEDIPGALGWTP